MRKILFLTCGILFSLSFTTIDNNRAMVTNTITLKDKEYYPDKTGLYDYYYEPYSWGGDINFPKDSIIESPIVLRSIENKEFSFEDLRDYCLSNLSDLSFWVRYERAGLNRRSNNDDEFLKYAQNIFSTKDTRRELFEYANRLYLKLQYSFPRTWKTYVLKRIEKCQVFTKDYTIKRNNYLKLEKKYDSLLNVGYYSQSRFVDDIGQYEAFIFRRIEHNKVPIQEINDYLSRAKTTISQTLDEGLYSNYRNLIINDGDLVISDDCINGVGAKVRLWNRNSSKDLVFQKFSGIKCLRNGDKNYYVIYHENKSTLINTELEIVHENSSSEEINKDKTEGIPSLQRFNGKYSPYGNYSLYGESQSYSVPSPNNKIVLKKKNGLYYVPAEVNDVELDFIFDTGASDVSISLTEAYFLFKNGKLTNSDVLGSEFFSDAKGDVSEGTGIIIRKMKVGNKVLYNVKASIVHNQTAPLLIGQSVFQRLGKMSVDFQNQTLTFE